MYSIIGGDGKEYGPVSADQIREWLAGRRLTLDMQIRREGETVWQRLGDLPEFAAPAALPPPLASSGQPEIPGFTPGSGDPSIPVPPSSTPPAPAAPPPPTPPEPLVFTGQWQEYFKIWIVNVLLTIVTFGIYAAWAKVRKRRYFHANTRLFGHTFEYLADPLKILWGNLIVVGLVLILAFSNVISPFLYLGMALLFAIAVPWFITRALTFNARNTAWRGLRFNFTGTYGQAARAYLLWPMLTVFTLGLIIPFIARKQKEFVVNRHAFGTSPFSLGGSTEDFYKIYGIAVLFFLPIIVAYFGVFGAIFAAAVKAGGAGKAPPPDLRAMGSFGLLFLVALPFAIAGTFYFRSRMFNYIWNHTSIAGNRFAASLRARDLFITHLVNSIVPAVTLGLMQPWATVRLVRLQLESVRVHPAGNIDTFVAAAQPPVGAVGDAASDFFDFDIGFGL